MTKSSNSWLALIATLVVAIGLAIAWGATAVWFGALLTQTPQTRYEQIDVGVEGDVYINSRSWWNWQDVESRTLDGQTVDLTDTDLLGFTYLSGVDRTPWLFKEPLTWGRRTKAASNQAKPPEAWYLIQPDDADANGGAYFEVYDFQSKRLVYYFGSQGRRQHQPPREEWFRTGPTDLNGSVATSRYAPTGEFADKYNNYGSKEPLKPWQWLLVDGDNLQLVDQQKQTSLTITELDGLLAVSTLQVPYGYQPPEVDWERVEKTGEAPPEDLPETDRKRAVITMITAWNGAQLLIWNPATDAIKTFDLPPRFHGASTLSVAWWGTEELILRRGIGNWGGGELVELNWIKPDGEIQRTEQVELAGYPPTRERDGAWAVTGVAPSPTVAVLATFIAPFAEFAMGKYPSYGEAFRHWFTELASPFGVIYVVSLLGAALVWRRHAKSRREHAWRWALMALLVGPAGVVAYWLHWRGQPHTACDDCDERVSRRHESCPACNAGWPTPPALGTEVFA